MSVSLAVEGLVDIWRVWLTVCLIACFRYFSFTPRLSYVYMIYLGGLQIRSYLLQGNGAVHTFVGKRSNSIILLAFPIPCSYYREQDTIYLSPDCSTDVL